MKRILTISLAGGLFFTGAFALDASPRRRADVAADPLWVLHLDADALRTTTIGRHVLAEMEKPDAQKKFAAFEAIFSFDPRKELHGITLYGMSKAEDDGVLLVYADFDANRLTTMAEGARDHTSTTDGRHTIHSWIDEKKKEKDGVKPRTYAAIHGKTVVFGQKQSRVTEALAVLDRAGASLATDKLFSGLGTGPGFIQGAARKLDALAGNGPNAAVLKQARTYDLNVDESQGRFEAALTLQAESEEVAKVIESVGRGLVALLSLQKEKPEAQKLAQGLDVRQDGPVVRASLSLPAEDVIALLKGAQAKKQAKQDKE